MLGRFRPGQGQRGTRLACKIARPGPGATLMSALVEWDYEMIKLLFTPRFKFAGGQ